MFDAYKIGVTLSLVDHATPSIGRIMRGLAATEAEAAKLQKRLDGIRAGFVGGVASIAAGLALAAPFKTGIEHAEKFERALLRLKNIGGIEPAVVARIRADALAGKYPSMSATETVDSFRDLHTAFGDAAHAMQFMPQFAKANAVSKWVYGKSAVQGERETLALAQVAERLGGSNSPEAMGRAIDLVARIRAGTGGNLGALDLRAFASTMGANFAMMSNEGIAKLTAYSTEVGASKAGTATNSLLQNFLFGRGTEASGFWMHKYGLVDETVNERNLRATYGDKWQAHRNKVTAGAAIGSDLLQKDVPGWVQRYALPALMAHGITKPEDLAKFASYMASNRKGAEALSTFLTQLPRVLKDFHLVEASKGIDEQFEAVKDSPVAKIDTLKARWETALTNLGEGALPVVVPLAEKLGSALKRFNEYAEKNPGTIERMTDGFIDLSAVLIGGGVISMLDSSVHSFKLLKDVLFPVSRGLGGAAEATSALSKAIAMKEVGGVVGIGRIAAALGPVGLAGALIALGAGAIALIDKITEANAGKNKPHGRGFLPDEPEKPKTMMVPLGHRGRGIVYAEVPVPSYSNEGHNRSVAPPAGAPQMVQVHTQINADGRKIADVVTRHQAREMSRPQTGPSGFDPRMALPPPSLK
ncbi:hypothetical protein [Ralstonia pseudosolanacearum]|uniref:hypothetical protein n=1 Tax=Ralstonia pseudosolanacearum TaxID=1310165 RepID=UPI000B94AF9B|nr:hypothetical protein [Ralstonia pseudosolanacearum]AST27081.1 hypothetical protein CDC45_07665 [Ralstonia pseudosolanacearum]MDC6286764.1 hypothetical protein [Ralstonia pseudosolanacearum]